MMVLILTDAAGPAKTPAGEQCLGAGRRSVPALFLNVEVSYSTPTYKTLFTTSAKYMSLLLVSSTHLSLAFTIVIGRPSRDSFGFTTHPQRGACTTIAKPNHIFDA